MSLSRRTFIALGGGASLLLALSGCTLSQEKSGPIFERTIDAVATTGMIGDLVINIGGVRTDLDTLMGPGVDPHPSRPANEPCGRWNAGRLFSTTGCTSRAG